MSKYKPMDLETDNSGDGTLALVMRALLSTGSHFTNAMRFSTSFGRGISLFMRVQVPESKLPELRAMLGHRCELKEPPKVNLDFARKDSPR